jgi:DNA-binding transcriptional ArsR family regulator
MATTDSSEAAGPGGTAGPGEGAGPGAAAGPGGETDDARTVTRVSDPRALRALAHPLRMALVGLLRMQGPLTATQAGALLGESSGSTSFHLRSLARYGLVEEAPGRHGRERPWRATAMFTQWGDDEAGHPAGAAAELLTAVVAERYFDDLKRWLAVREDAPPSWRAADHFGDTELWLTADELSALDGEVRALTDRYLARTTEPGLRPPGSRPVTYLHLAFPMMSIAGWPVPPGLAEVPDPGGPGLPAGPATSATNPTADASPTSPINPTSPARPAGAGPDRGGP